MVKFTHEGIEYLRDANNIVYDIDTQEEIGEWDGKHIALGSRINIQKQIKNKKGESQQNNKKQNENLKVFYYRYLVILPVSELRIIDYFLLPVSRYPTDI